MKIRCPNCSVTGNIPGDAVSRRAHCPNCNHQFIITSGIVESGVERRKSKRVPSKGIYCYFNLFLGASDVLDISTAGLCVDIPTTDTEMRIGERLTITIHVTKDVVLNNMEVEVRRNTNGMLGCRFVGTSKQQISHLEALVSAIVFNERLEEADSVTLEMDEQTIELKARGYL